MKELNYNYYRNNTPISFEEKLKIENILYKQNIINKLIQPEKIIIKNILRREIKIFYDKSFNFPQTFFIFNYKNHTIVGRKIRSKLHIQNKINAIHCSQITSSMILGILYKKEEEKDTIKISFFPFKKAEKITLFNIVSKDRMINIEYPFRYKEYFTKKEKKSSDKGWSLNKNKVIYLGYGEEHIREYTKKYFLKNNLYNKYTVIYDPACSTGQFLYELKKTFPIFKTIGQDLSKEMVDYAKDYVDEIYCGNSLNTSIVKESIDILILRFLNSEVVSTIMAYKLFKKLIKTVKRNGLIICFGHTPILIRKKYFLKRKDLQIINCNGYCETTNSIFQYYVLKKI